MAIYYQGGGIYNGGTLTLTSSTLSGNSALFGGGIYNYNPASLTIISSIVSLNQAGTGPNIFDWNDPGGNYNLIGGNPRLAPLGWYGGPTQTMALRAGSPAIGGGAPNATDAEGNLLSTDQRGVARPTGKGAVPDIGSFQSQPARLVFLTQPCRWGALVNNRLFQFQVKALDASNHPQPGVTVTLRLLPIWNIGWAEFSMESKISAVTGANGLATFTHVAVRTYGLYRIEAKAGLVSMLSNIFLVGLHGIHCPWRGDCSPSGKSIPTGSWPCCFN
jgi:hypothetical protein